MGRVQVLEYQGARGEGLYHRAKPPALGHLHATWHVRTVAPLAARLRAGSVPYEEHGVVRTLCGEGRMISFCSPAGYRIEVQEEREDAS